MKSEYPAEGISFLKQSRQETRSGAQKNEPRNAPKTRKEGPSFRVIRVFRGSLQVFRGPHQLLDRFTHRFTEPPHAADE